jgi:hypothetical protein
MDQLSMFPTTRANVQVALELDGTWSVGVSLHNDRDAWDPRLRSLYTGLSLHEVCDVVCASLWTAATSG